MAELNRLKITDIDLETYLSGSSELTGNHSVYDEVTRRQLNLLLLKYKQTKSEDIKEQIFKMLMPLLKFFAYRYSKGSIEFDDLVQVASIGLLKAIERFEPEVGSDFLSYAIPTITGEMKRYLRDSSWLVKVPRHLKELKSRIIREIPILQLKLGRKPRIDEIAQALSIPKEEVIEAMELLKPISLNSGDKEGESPTLEEKIGIEEKEFEKLESLAELENILRNLEPMERYVLYLKFFYGLSQMEIARKLNVSQMTVSRIQNRALKKLRDLLNGDKGIKTKLRGERS